MIKSVAFIGSVGIPNNYGGFESFLEKIVPEFSSRNWMVYVTCEESQ